MEPPPRHEIIRDLHQLVIDTRGVVVNLTMVRAVAATYDLATASYDVRCAACRLAEVADGLEKLLRDVQDSARKDGRGASASPPGHK